MEIGHPTIFDKLCTFDSCTGCFACKQSCAKGAIHIKAINGFLYPEIDSSLCVGCGACTKTCPVLNLETAPKQSHSRQSVCYAVWNVDLRDRMNSSSGGVFSALAKNTINAGGIVYGAAWDKKMHLHHIGINKIENLDLIRRSKYVQSDIDGIYQDVKEHLKSGDRVLFCGTPCQVAGLLSFMGYRDYPNLITVGVVCHGVPSQWSFDKYIREIENKNNIKIEDFNFRSKKYGWRTGLNAFAYGKNNFGEEKKLNLFSSNNAYFNSYLKYYFLRESCYNCPFKEGGQEQVADVMLSDFWNLWASVSVREIDFGKGVSAVVANSIKGKAVLMQCADSLQISKREYSEYAANTGLRRARKPLNNDIAFEYLQTHSWRETQDIFFPLRIHDKIPIYARLFMGENISIIIKKIINKIKTR